MRNTLFVLLSGVLMLSAAFAQESGSVDDVLKELADYKAPEMSAATTPAAADAAAVALDVRVDRVVEEPLPTGAATVEAVIAELDVEAVVEESRALYVNGEFERAQAGFETVIKRKPENMIARMYLRKLLERDARCAEVSGMKAVDAAWCAGMVLRSYAVSGEAAEKMGLADADAITDITAKFPEVDFPKGANAVYQPRLEKLFVRNTRDNLLVLEEILEAMDVAKLSADVDQVEIETKFVEVSEGTLEELGFEWRNTGTDIRLSDGVVVDGSYHLFDDALRTVPFGQPSTLGAGSTAGTGNWSAFQFENTFNTAAASMLFKKSGENGSTPFDLLIQALDQSSGTDVLSAPRVVTKSGETATIRVGELHIYPEVYEVGASAGNIIHVKYEDWEERLLGIELEVTPQVDGDQIELALSPKVLELQGWQTYDVAPSNSAYTYVQEDIANFFDNHAAITARLPIFRKREIDTEVTIADGATIGMGGLINEKIEAFEDKVPLLGSLPLVGRLFRNEGERAIKRNLLMFVTAKKVEPTGRISSSRSFE